MKALSITLIIFAFIGFVDASYLTAQHYGGDSVVCEIGGHSFGNCNDVLDSEYATVVGIPVALIGAIYYFTLFVLSTYFFTEKKQELLKLITLISGAGFLATLYFVYLQLFVLNAICIYCMVSAVATTLLFIVSILASQKINQQEIVNL